MQPAPTLMVVLRSKTFRPGSYKFFAYRAGFVDQYYKTGNNDTGPLFSLRPGEKVSDVLFRLIVAAVITGRITNEDGDGMQRVQVFALRRPTQEETEDEEELPRHRKIQIQSVASAEDRGDFAAFRGGLVIERNRKL